MRLVCLPALAFLIAAVPCRAAGLVVTGPDGKEREVAAETLASLPPATVTVGDNTPAQSHRFEGPLLWAVLGHVGAVDAAQFRGHVRQHVVLTGRDGYTAIVAMGEIAPEFEGKAVIVALRMDGQPLDPDHLRVVVPGDKRGGRGVHDLVRISITALPR